MARRSAAEAARTRDDVLTSARHLFTERGYHDVSVPEIAKAAGVTHGALYHHFTNKQGLFRAVFEQVEHELNDAVVTAALAEPTTWDAFVAGARAVLDARDHPAYQQVALVDAPSVLGWHEWGAVDASIGMQTVRAGLDLLVDDGFLAGADLDALSVLLFGALTEGTISLARGITTVERDQLVDAVCRIVLALSPGAEPPNDRWRHPSHT
jgi:AcrR family transcriptional regulator